MTFWKPRPFSATILSLLLLAGAPYILSIFMASQNFVDGREKLKTGDADGAISAFKTATELDLLPSDPHRGLAQSHYLRYKTKGFSEDLVKAIQEQNEAIARNRIYGVLWAELGYYLKEAGRDIDAAAAFEKAGILKTEGFL